MPLTENTGAEDVLHEGEAGGGDFVQLQALAIGGAGEVATHHVGCVLQSREPALTGFPGLEEHVDGGTASVVIRSDLKTTTTTTPNRGG